MSQTPGGTTVARASGIMIAAILLSRILGQARETVIAFRFGQGVEADMYRAAFSVPDLLFFLIAGGALSSAFIPVFSEYFHTDRKEEAWRLFGIMATFMGLVVGGFVILTEVFAFELVRVVAPGFGLEQAATTAYLSRIVLPAQFAFFLGGLLFATFYARNHFLTPALAPNIYNLGIICGALFLVPFVEPPVSALMWGALAGAMVGSLIIPVWVFRRTGGVYKPGLDLKDPRVVKVFKLMLPVVLGLSLPGVYALLVRAMASTADPGSVAAVENANRIMQAPLGIFGQALALAVFPSLSLFAARKEWDNFSATLHRSLRVVLFLTIPASALLLAVPEDILRTLLQYGKFRPEDTVYAASALRLFAIGVPAWSAQAVLMRGFFSLQDTLTPVILGTVTTAIFLPLSWALMHTEIGYAGLALGVSLSATLLFVLMLVGIRRKVGTLEGRRLGGLLAGSLVAATLASGIGLILAGLVRTALLHSLGQPNIASALAALTCLCSIAVFYLWIGKLLGLEETKYALSMVARRFGARPQPNARPPES
ncbi:MAG: hypothetical protein AMXMBFR61_24740 [Fimbriimonadales bacterium]